MPSNVQTRKSLGVWLSFARVACRACSYCCERISDSIDTTDELLFGPWATSIPQALTNTARHTRSKVNPLRREITLICIRAGKNRFQYSFRVDHTISSHLDL